MTPLVSILIPAHNAAGTLEQTIQSALAQTWARTEIVVVDDGSTDATLAIARRHPRPRVFVLTQHNAGASAARNAALAVAQGDYIQWLDADDLLAPDKIERQMQAMAEQGSARTLLSGPFGEFTVAPQRATFRSTELWRDLTPLEFLMTKFTANAWLNTAVWLVSRALTAAAGPWDERLSLDDDGEYFCRVVARSEGVHFVPGARVYYRRGNPRSLSRSLSDGACESLLLSLGLCIAQLRALEDSQRTRAASLALLQNWSDLSCFYPDKVDRRCRLEALARECGGTLTPPQLGWKYAPVRALLGWGAARRAKAVISHVKLLARVRRDRFVVGASKVDPP